MCKRCVRGMRDWSLWPPLASVGIAQIPDILAEQRRQ